VPAPSASDHDVAKHTTDPCHSEDIEAVFVDFDLVADKQLTALLDTGYRDKLRSAGAHGRRIRTPA